jgi:hypothetical protein
MTWKSIDKILIQGIDKIQVVIYIIHQTVANYSSIVMHVGCLTNNYIRNITFSIILLYFSNIASFHKDQFKKYNIIIILEKWNQMDTLLF